eukprot:TRINITY_DN7542_c0_g1_i1.p1 TRINITY_DN7542_c0_g1~~TRINITY_DN7542_c0_g1_i1.p1  ORF type:complete len:150 (+),score=20.35 TRINITY_DN7542_c0_g1_i1:18-467(+)
MKHIYIFLVLSLFTLAVSAQFGSDYRQGLKDDEKPEFDCLVCKEMVKQAEALLDDSRKRWKNKELAVQAVMEANPCKWDDFKKYTFDTSGLVESCWDNFYANEQELEEVLIDTARGQRVEKFCTELTSLCRGIDFESIENKFIKPKDEL